MQELKDVLIERLGHNGPTGVICDRPRAPVHAPDREGKEGFDVAGGVKDEDDILWSLTHGAVLEERGGEGGTEEGKGGRGGVKSELVLLEASL